MNKDQAIDYLKRKGEFYDETELTKQQEARVKKVMKEGEIYGDPLVILND